MSGNRKEVVGCLELKEVVCVCQSLACQDRLIDPRYHVPDQTSIFVKSQATNNFLLVC